MIYTVILSAGSSTRMGGKPKALLRDQAGHSYLQRIATAAREGGSGGVLVVVGPPHGEAIKKALPPGVGTALNPRPERGMLSSVQVALQSLPGTTIAALVWPVDVPFVAPRTVRAICNAAPGKLVVPTHNGKGGHPIRIPRALFPELMALDQDGGLKALIDAHAAQVERLAVDDPAVLVDVDTPDDHAKAEAAATAPAATAPAVAAPAAAVKKSK